MARLYANENFPLAGVEGLRKLGHDVLTVREAGRDNQRIDDNDVLTFAIAEQRALVTINRRDFIRLHRQLSGLHGSLSARKTLTVKINPDGSTRQSPPSSTLMGNSSV